MKYEIIIIGIMIAGSILAVGTGITDAINKNAGWELQKAYMKGISAKEMELPCDMSSGSEYIISFHSSMDGTVTKVYPGVDTN